MPTANIHPDLEHPVGKVLLPDGFLDVPSKDLLLRLLQVEPKQRLRSLRTLTTISFFKGYNFEDVKKKKVQIKL